MPHTDTRPLQLIKRETEQTRAGLTDTVEQLRTSVAETASDIRQRIKPDAIKSEVSEYIKSRGERLLDDVTAAARRNPMQAVAVGATVAYPLLRLARTIPFPVLMVGAGLFLVGSKTGKSDTRKAGEMAPDISDEVGRRAREFGNQVGESASAAKTYASDQLDRVSAAAESGGTDEVSRAVNAAGATLAPNSQKLQEKGASFGASASNRADLRDEGIRSSAAAATVQDIASGATSVGQRAIDASTDAGLDAARAVRDKASDLTEHAGKTIFETIEQNPLVVAGVGFLVGGLIASALPRTDIEDDLVGDASGAVKRRARDAASQGFETAKDTVGEVVDEATRQAQEEGLSPDGLGQAAQDIGQRMRRVAETAVTTAFEPTQDDQPSARGGTDHG